MAKGLIDAPYWFQLCLSIPYGTPLDIGLLLAMVNRLPDKSEFTSFGLGAMQMPMVSQSVMLGGHVRVGLEDNLYLERGRPGHQRPVGGEGSEDHRAHGCPDPDAGRRPPDPEDRLIREPSG